jgi:hypothetical protein
VAGDAVAASPAEARRPASPRTKDEIDIDVLTDKVEQRLLRRVAAERERRGGVG